MDINYGDIIVLNSELKRKKHWSAFETITERKISPFVLQKMGCIFPVKDHKIGRKRRNM